MDESAHESTPMDSNRALAVAKRRLLQRRFRRRASLPSPEKRTESRPIGGLQFPTIHTPPPSSSDHTQTNNKPNDVWHEEENEQVIWGIKDGYEPKEETTGTIGVAVGAGAATGDDYEKVSGETSPLSDALLTHKEDADVAIQRGQSTAEWTSGQQRKEPPMLPTTAPMAKPEPPPIPPHPHNHDAPASAATDPHNDQTIPPPVNAASVVPSEAESVESHSTEPIRLAVDDAIEVLDWSGKGLKVAGVHGGWAMYPTITTLILKDNELTTLVKQGLEFLPNLQTLDLRRNRLTGFGDTLLVLSNCRSLKHVYLHQSTRDHVTTSIALYTDFVFQSLRGLETCDDVRSTVTIRLNPLDQSAFEFIHLISGGMSENQLLRCDLSNLNLPAHLFFFILSALYQLKVAWLKLDGSNEWASLNSYSNCVIFYLGKYLLYLDDTEITYQHLHLALRAQNEAKVKITKLPWEECWEEALEAAREYIEERRMKEEEEAIRQQLLSAWQLSSDGTASMNGPNDGFAPPTKSYQLSNGYLSKVSTGGSKVGPSNPTTISSHNSNVGIDRQLSNKLEIFIHYLQIYGLVLLSSIQLTWPDAFYRFSEWVRLWTLNLDSWFSFLPFQNNIFFWIASFVPVLFIWVFWRISKIRSKVDAWVESYIIQWKTTRLKVISGYALFTSLGFLFSFLFIDSVYAGHSPTSLNLSISVSFLVLPTLLLLCWYGFIRYFRKIYYGDHSSDKDQFRNEWGSKMNNIQWFMLFLITNTFMPIARIILRQFECLCDGQGEINVNLNDPSMCYAVINTSMQCFPTEFTATQITAFIFGSIYLIGIPVFYYVLISKTVQIVLSTSRQYKLLTAEIRRLKSLPKAERVLVEDDLREYQRVQYKLYYCIMNDKLNRVPASSLFAAYQEKFKYTKLFQMFQKLLLVIITLFIPDRLFADSSPSTTHGGQIICAAIVIIGYLLVVLVARPYNDPLDDSFDILCQAANTTNVLIAMSLIYQVGWLTTSQANILLFVINGIILLSFIFVCIYSPLKTYWYRQKLKPRITQEEEVETEKIKQLLAGVQGRKEKRVSAMVKSELPTGPSDTLVGPQSDEQIAAATPMIINDQMKPSRLEIDTGDEDHLKVSSPVQPHIVRIHDDEEESSNECSRSGSGSESSVDSECGLVVRDAVPVTGVPTIEDLARGGGGTEASPTEAQPIRIHIHEPLQRATTTTEQPANPIPPLPARPTLKFDRDHQLPLGESRKSSISATMPTRSLPPPPLPSRPTLQPHIASGGGMMTVGRRGGKQIHLRRPSLASLAELFKASTPTTANQPPITRAALESSATVRQEHQPDQQPQLGPAASISQTGALTTIPTSVTSESSPAHLQFPPSSLDSSNQFPIRPTTLTIDDEFDNNFTRSGAELSRLKHLALLKLCSPASSSLDRMSSVSQASNESGIKPDMNRLLTPDTGGIVGRPPSLSQLPSYDGSTVRLRSNSTTLHPLDAVAPMTRLNSRSRAHSYGGLEIPPTVPTSTIPTTTTTGHHTRPSSYQHHHTSGMERTLSSGDSDALAHPHHRPPSIHIDSFDPLTHVSDSTLADSSPIVYTPKAASFLERLLHRTMSHHHHHHTHHHDQASQENTNGNNQTGVAMVGDTVTTGSIDSQPNTTTIMDSANTNSTSVTLPTNAELARTNN